ncbi:hypothetical protein V8E51_018572 [Hyaloscypha variabilis]
MPGKNDSKAAERRAGLVAERTNKDLCSAALNCQHSFLPITELVLCLTGFPRKRSELEQAKEEGIQTWTLAGDELQNFIEVMQKRIQATTKSNTNPPGRALFEHCLLRYGINVDSGLYSECAFSIEDAQLFSEYIRALDQSSLRQICMIKNFQTKWQSEVIDWGLDGLAAFAKDPEVAETMRSIELLLQSRFAEVATMSCVTSISAGATLLVLMRLKQRMMALDAKGDQGPDFPLTLLGKLLEYRDRKRVTLCTWEVKVLDKLYTQVELTEESYLEDLAQHMAASATASWTAPPTKFAQTLLTLEMHITLWQEQMLDSAFASLNNEKLVKTTDPYRMINIDDSLSDFTIIPKSQLLRAFAQNIPIMKFSPQDPSLSDVHWECRQEMRSLQRKEAEWSQWTTDIIVLLDIPATTDMKTTTSRTTAIMSNVRALKELVVRYKAELVAGEAASEAVLAESFQKDTEYRKKKDELRKELKEKDTRIQELEVAARELDQLKKDHARQNMAELEKELKNRERMVTDREEKAKIKEEELKKAHRQGKKDTLKEAKTNDAQLTKQLREEQKKSSDLEKQLESTTTTMNILQLDLDAYVGENQELKKLGGLAHKDEDQQAEITALRNEVEKYKKLTEAARPAEKVVKQRSRTTQSEANTAALADKEKLEDLVDALFKKLAEKDRQLRSAKDEIQRLNDQCMASGVPQMTVLAANQKIRELSKESADLQKQLAARDLRIAKIESMKEEFLRLICDM